MFCLKELLGSLRTWCPGVWEPEVAPGTVHGRGVQELRLATLAQSDQRAPGRLGFVWKAQGGFGGLEMAEGAPSDLHFRSREQVAGVSRSISQDPAPSQVLWGRQGRGGRGRQDLAPLPFGSRAAIVRWLNADRGLDL